MSGLHGVSPAHLAEIQEATRSIGRLTEATSPVLDGLSGLAEATSPVLDGLSGLAEATSPVLDGLSGLAEATSPLFAEATSPLFAEATSPLFAEATSPLFAEATSPLFAEATSPLFAEATSPLFAEATSPLFAEATSPLFAEATSPLFAKATSPLFAEATSPLFAEATFPMVDGLSGWAETTFPMVDGLSGLAETTFPMVDSFSLLAKENAQTNRVRSTEAQSEPSHPEASILSELEVAREEEPWHLSFRRPRNVAETAKSWVVGLASRKRVRRPVASGLCGVAEFFCSRKSFEQIYEPLITDIRVEHSEALASGRTIKAQWISVRGYATFVEAFLAHTAGWSVHLVVRAWRIFM